MLTLTSLLQESFIAISLLVSMAYSEALRKFS